MALRLTAGVVRGTLDNTQRGTVTGEIWLLNHDAPLRLSLAGDCLRDLAGCRCTFANPTPQPLTIEGLATDQSGEVGDLTASRKVRITPARAADADAAPAAPACYGNALYLEWFSDRNGRVVIESIEFSLAVSPPAWLMSAADEERQVALNADAMRRFLDQVQAALMPPRRARLADDRNMDEYEWELFLREAEARGERCSELLDKYLHHPQADVLVARAMGWNALAEALQKASAGDAADDGETATDADLDDAFNEWLTEPEPDPALEGKTWMRTPEGRLVHPLTQRCFTFGIRLHEDQTALEKAGRLPAGFSELAAQVQCTSTKLAGVLDSLAYEVPLEPGLIAAGLKRALALLNEALGALTQVAPDLEPEPATAYRDELFALRTAILTALEQARRGEPPSGD